MISSGGVAFAAPGRVNLIGEHTDYTGGYVMPMAISFATRATVQSAVDGRYHFASEMFPDKDRTLERNEPSRKEGTWSDYPIGVLRELQALGIDVPAFKLHLAGDVPLGAGLSSSASVEVVTAVALLAHAGQKLPLQEIARLAQRAENAYVGSPCGIMDQFASTAARKGFALLLQTRTLEYELLPMNSGDLAECQLVIVNSGIKHSIRAGDGGYEARRRQSEDGQKILRTKFSVLDLGTSTLAQLEETEAEMSPESYKRCRHIISENARVLSAATAMREGDAIEMGVAMSASHVSQRDDFECSVPEVDFLVDAALALPGCYGSRLTGGGFGGCTVSLVRADTVDAFVAEIKDSYRSHYGREPDAFICAASDGAVALHPEVMP